MIVKPFNFFKYNPDSELYSNNESEIGDYWKFLNLSIDDINSHNIYLPRVCEIVMQVSDANLKAKMTNKLISLIKENKGLNDCIKSELFTSDDKKEMIKIVQENRLIPFIKESCDNNDNCSDIDKDKIIEHLNLLFYLDDPKWQYEQMLKILERFKRSDIFDELIVKVLEKIRSQKCYMLFNSLLNTYSGLIPESYINYIKISNDENYFYNKSKKFEESNISIGIDPKISIGVEIETNHPYNLIYDVKKQSGYARDYSTEIDASVSSGIEVISKPFHDTVPEISKFSALCDSLTEMGYYYDEVAENAGGQINLGLDYLDSAKSILNFYEIFGNCEELLFYISNEEGQLKRLDNWDTRFKPVSEIIGSRLLDEDISREKVIEMFNSSIDIENNKAINELTYKRNSVCLRGETDDDYRFELRIPNGGNNYKTWIDNIRLYAKMMEVSKKISDSQNKDYLTEDEEKCIRLKMDLENRSMPLEEKLDILMDLLFESASIKKIYYARFHSVISKIKATNSTKYLVPGYSNEPLFDSVEFQDKYESKLEQPGNVSYDPETDTYIENGVVRKI